MIAHAGYEYVVDKITPQLTNKENKDLKSMYQKFKEHYDVFTKEYSQEPTQSFINRLKDTIKEKSK